MPGGVGTADEFFDVLNHVALGLIDKKIFIFNKNDCWTYLLNWIDKNIEQDMLGKLPDTIFVTDTVNGLIESITKNEL